MRKRDRLPWEQYCAIRKVNTKSYIKALKIRDYEDFLLKIPGADVLPPKAEEIPSEWYFDYKPPTPTKQSVIQKQLEEIRKEREVDSVIDSKPKTIKKSKLAPKKPVNKPDVPKRISTKKTTRRKSSHKKEE
jgi:hypothetical protein